MNIPSSRSARPNHRSQLNTKPSPIIARPIAGLFYFLRSARSSRIGSNVIGTESVSFVACSGPCRRNSFRSHRRATILFPPRSFFLACLNSSVRLLNCGTESSQAISARRLLSTRSLITCPSHRRNPVAGWTSRPVFAARRSATELGPVIPAPARALTPNQTPLTAIRQIERSVLKSWFSRPSLTR